MPETGTYDLHLKRKANPRAVVWARMNRSDGGKTAATIRPFADGMAHRIFLRVASPFIRIGSKSYTMHQLLGRPFSSMLGNREEIRKRKMQNSWQEVCSQLVATIFRRCTPGTDDFSPLRRVYCQTSSSALAIEGFVAAGRVRAVSYPLQ